MLKKKKQLNEKSLVGEGVRVRAETVHVIYDQI